MRQHDKELYKCFIIWFAIGVFFGYIAHTQDGKCQVEVTKGQITTVAVGNYEK